MRDPNRLTNFYEEIEKVHKEYFPDWRFGQLYSNFFTWLVSVKKKDPFFIEESQMKTLLEEYISYLFH